MIWALQTSRMEIRRLLNFFNPHVRRNLYDSLCHGTGFKAIVLIDFLINYRA